MEDIIKVLQTIDTERNHMHKHDLICALGGVESLLKAKIDKIESTRFNDVIPINGLGFSKEYHHDKLISVRQVKLVKFCYIDNFYLFQIGSEASNETLHISANCYPVNEYDNRKFVISRD